MLLQDESRQRRAIPKPVIEYEYVWMEHDLFYAITILVALEILLCIFCLAAITLFFRKHLIFLKSGVRLTYLFLIGCIMVLLSVPLFGIDSKVTPFLNIPAACMARIWLLNVGFTLSVGVIIVRVVYTTIVKLDASKKSVICTSRIIYLVSGLVIIDSLIVAAWRSFSPPQKDYATKKIEDVGFMDQRITLVENCNSEKEPLLVLIFCFYKGLMLLVAVLLAFFWKGEEETRNQDFKESKVGLLSAFIISSVALPVVLSIPMHPNISFAIGGLFILLEVGFLMFWIIFTKIMKAYTCRKGDAKGRGRYVIEGQTRIPCMSNVYGCVNDEERQQFYNEGFDASEVGFSLHFPSGTTATFKDTSDNMDEYGFDCKVSEDFLPSDLAECDAFNLKEYKPTEENENGEDDEEEEVVMSDKDTSDESNEDSHSSDSEGEEDDLPTKSKCSLRKSVASVRSNKSSKPTLENELERTSETIQTNLCSVDVVEGRQSSPALTNNIPDTRATTASSEKSRSNPSGNKKWWQPLFGAFDLFRSKKKESSQEDAEGTDSDEEEYEGSTDSNSSSSGEESEIEPERT